MALRGQYARLPIEEGQLVELGGQLRAGHCRAVPGHEYLGVRQLMQDAPQRPRPVSRPGVRPRDRWPGRLGQVTEEGDPDPAFGHAGFARWRQELLAQGHDAVDFEGGEGCITVALNPADLRIVGRLNLDEALALRESMDELDEVFDPAARIALLRALAEPAARSPRRPKP